MGKVLPWCKFYGNLYCLTLLLTIICTYSFSALMKAMSGTAMRIYCLSLSSATKLASQWQSAVI